MSLPSIQSLPTIPSVDTDDILLDDMGTAEPEVIATGTSNKRRVNRRRRGWTVVVGGNICGAVVSTVDFESGGWWSESK
ncbi:hypothetical protein M8J77_018312 [Diaphorina citri]|nr:hypothetical protein M8J77_018312 [Diaphorina citri]